MQKDKILRIIGYVVLSILVINTIFLATVAISSKDGNASVFGKNIYIIQSNSFAAALKGSAAITKAVPAAELKSGDMIIYKNNDGGNAPAIIKKVDLNSITLDGQSAAIAKNSYVARIERFSLFWGFIISFALSPAGVLLFAVIPCIIIIGLEVYKLFRDKLPAPEVEPINKKDYFNDEYYEDDDEEFTAIASPAAIKKEEKSDVKYYRVVGTLPNKEKSFVAEVKKKELFDLSGNPIYGKKEEPSKADSSPLFELKGVVERQNDVAKPSVASKQTGIDGASFVKHDEEKTAEKEKKEDGITDILRIFDNRL